MYIMTDIFEIFGGSCKRCDCVLPTCSSSITTQHKQLQNTTMPLPRQRSVGDRKGRSRVSIAREVDIGLDEQAPRGELPSLDFDRVVNSYSIEATKKRLLFHQKLFASKKDKVHDEYRDFKESFASGDKSPKLLKMPYGKQVMTWVLTLLTGMMCGLIAILILYCVEHIVSLRSDSLNRMMQYVSGTSDAEKDERIFGDWFAGQFGMAGIYFEMVLFNMILAVLSSAMCVYYGPKAIGSGIPEVKAYLNGVRVPSFADTSTFLTKIVGTILSVSSGLVVGPEGPLVHIGAIVGRGLTNTSFLDVALRDMQKGHPRISGWLGCAKTGAFGEKKQQEQSRIEKLVQYSQANESELSLLIDEEEEVDFGSLQPLPHAKFRSRSQAMKAVSDMTSGAAISDGPVTKMSIFVSSDSLPRPSIMTTGTSDSMDLQTLDQCNPEINFFSNIVSSLSGFRNDIDRRDLISIGVAVGFAAAFGAPVGGLLYSIEEASSFFSIRLMWRTLLATALGTFMIAIYHGDLSRYSILSLGFENDGDDNDGGNVLSSDKAFMTRFQEIPWYIIIGFGGGMLGALFNQSYKVTSYWRSKFYGDYKLTEVAVVSFLTSSIMFLLPILLPQSWACADVKEQGAGMPGAETSSDDRFNCQPGQFNQVGAILLGSRDDALNDILSDPTMFEASTLLICGLVFLFLMMITFGVALPSGLFMPTLLTGSSLGGFAGIMIQRHILETIDPAHFALFGAAAMLGGVQRTTVSLCVILMEATGKTQVLIPLIISIVVARYVGDIFNDGYYHIIMHMKHYPFLEHHIMQSYDIPTVANIMTSPVITLNDVETAGTLETILRENAYSTFPVVNMTTKEYIGMMRRDQVVALLECGIYVDDSPNCDRSKTAQIREIMQRANMQETSQALIRDDDIYSSRRSWERSSKKKGHRKVVSLLDEHIWLKDNLVQTNGGKVLIGSDETMPGASIPQGQTIVEYDELGNLIVKLSGDDRQKLVDIGAAMNRGAYSIVQNTPLSKAYEIFTALGLRTLPVLGEKGCVVGIVARSNLQPEYMESRTGLQMG